jgi:hypothetical protein
MVTRLEQENLHLKLQLQEQSRLQEQSQEQFQLRGELNAICDTVGMIAYDSCEVIMELGQYRASIKLNSELGETHIKPAYHVDKTKALTEAYTNAISTAKAIINEPLYKTTLLEAYGKEFNIDLDMDKEPDRDGYYTGIISIARIGDGRDYGICALKAKNQFILSEKLCQGAYDIIQKSE